jgi:hypothetical protein
MIGPPEHWVNGRLELQAGFLAFQMPYAIADHIGCFYCVCCSSDSPIVSPRGQPPYVIQAVAVLALDTEAIQNKHDKAHEFMQESYWEVRFCCR